MDMPGLASDAGEALEKVLGYLNFSSGARDPQFLAGLNQLYSAIEQEPVSTPDSESKGGTSGIVADGSATDASESHSASNSGSAASSDKVENPDKLESAAVSLPSRRPNRRRGSSEANETQASPPIWTRLRELLVEHLDELAESSSAFRDTEQARAVIDLTFDRCLNEYFNFHSDLLFHQSKDALFNSFFLGCVAEAVIRQGAPWDESDRIVAGAIEQLNDYVGFRPVPQLESQRLEPYPHERIRPIPLYIQGAGVAVGPTQYILERALELLRETDTDLLRAAQFDPDNLYELAIDPRAYDFDHPVNKRPNHHFGQWDPDTIDGQGNFTRFVIQQVTLDALTNRIHGDGDIPREELVEEAAAVLAGTILMASGISGSGPGAYDSTVTLSTLLPVIAAYRDVFYERLFDKLNGEHSERLKQESVDKRQPFGGARQHLNSELARARASQLEHVHLAMIFGRMGFADAALRQANIVPVASARMFCQIDCAIDAAMQAIQSGDLHQAADHMPKIRSLLKRGIECGAIIDPWNILGFDGNFSLFPAIENSVRDHRADDLVGLIEQIFAVYSRLWSEAAAVDDTSLVDRIRTEFQNLAEWWRQFAAHEVQSVDAVDSLIVFHAAEHVAQALSVWHQGGASTGDVKFWAGHAEIFDSPKACALVVDALMQRGDDVASMAILNHWLLQADEIGLEEGDSSFHVLAENWMAKHYQRVVNGKVPDEELNNLTQQARRFFEYLEANAEEYWIVPKFSLAKPPASNSSADVEEEMDGEEDSSENLYGAAWENVVYRDSTDDGQEGQIFDGDSLINDELEEVSLEISERLEFIATLSSLWKLSAGIVAYRPPTWEDLKDEETLSSTMKFASQRCEILTVWTKNAFDNRSALSKLMEDVRKYPLPKPGGDHDSMVEYDRQRLAKESLLERIISASVGYDDAIRWLLAAKHANRAYIELINGRIKDTSLKVAVPDAPQVAELSEEKQTIVKVFAASLNRDRDLVGLLVPPMIDSMKRSALLYVPMAKGGNPHDIVEARGKQQAFQELLLCLPKLGLILQTRELLEAARDMERNNPVGHGAVTEFDELYKIGYIAMVESLVVSSRSWAQQPHTEGSEKTLDTASALFDSVERVTETMLMTWLAHSRTLRLSVLEKVSDNRSWEPLVEFIQRYGEDLFSQRFFNLGNLRAILHQGVDAWLAQLEEDPGDYDLRLLDELGGQLKREDAVSMLTLILESIIENYAEYRDYNSTTTQSDQGEALYMLLDFLRLRTQYDRVAWHLKPVVWSHATLVRHGEKHAARLWRRALTERLADEPDKYLGRLAKLQAKYAMRMPTVADRLTERFIQPLQIDRIKALVEPAMKDPSQLESRRAFELLEHEVDVLTREPSGVGLDIPHWLASLEEEVEQVRHRLSELEIDPWGLIEPIPLTLDDAREQLRQMKDDADASE